MAPPSPPEGFPSFYSISMVSLSLLRYFAIFTELLYYFLSLFFPCREEYGS